MHGREQIEAALVAALVDLPGVDTGANVFREPPYMIPADRVPCITLDSVDEAISDSTRGGAADRRLERVLEVTATIIVRQAQGLATEINAIAEQIEIAVVTDAELAALALRPPVRVESFTRVVDDQAEQPTMSGAMVISIRYRTTADDPATIRE